MGGAVTALRRESRWRPSWLATVSKDGAEKSIYVRGDRGEGSSFPLAYETTVLQVLENGIPVPHVYGMCEDAQAIIMDNVTGGRQMTGVTTDGKKFATYAVLQGHALEAHTAAGGIDVDQELLLDRHGAVALLTLNRPDRLNALTLPMMARFTQLMEELNDDPDVRAIVITGAGRGFCSGLDVKENTISKGTWRSAYRAMRFNEHEIARMRGYAKPLIAAVNGVAVGGGLGIALACDIRIGSANASFCAAFAKHGMPPQDAVAAYLPDAVGLSKALEMIFTAKTVRSEEALACGLISELTANETLLERALEFAGMIAEGPPVALAMAKQVVYRGRGKPIDEQMALQTLGTFLNKAYAPDDLREAASAFAEKRKPRFTGT